MAPPNFPQGMTLHSLGFAALKYPELPPPPVPVPLNNQVGVLQRQSAGAQTQMTAQLASQYLQAFIDYQVSDDPFLNDPADPQYYFSTTVMILNFMSMSPDVCKRIAKHPTLLNTIVERMLAPDYVERMKAVDRTTHHPDFPPATFDSDFGSILQFLSTMLLYRDEIENLHPRIGELVPKMKVWKREYRSSPVKTIKNAAERLVWQIENTEPEQTAYMRGAQAGSLACGVSSCGVSGATELTVCAVCRVQRYCGRDHQKADWKYHKHICCKGLGEA